MSMQSLQVVSWAFSRSEKTANVWCHCAKEFCLAGSILTRASVVDLYFLNLYCNGVSKLSFSSSHVNLVNNFLHQLANVASERNWSVIPWFEDMILASYHVDDTVPSLKILLNRSKGNISEFSDKWYHLGWNIVTFLGISWQRCKV